MDLISKFPYVATRKDDGEVVLSTRGSRLIPDPGVKDAAPEDFERAISWLLQDEHLKAIRDHRDYVIRNLLALETWCKMAIERAASQEFPTDQQRELLRRLGAIQERIRALLHDPGGPEARAAGRDQIIRQYRDAAQAQPKAAAKRQLMAVVLEAEGMTQRAIHDEILGPGQKADPGRKVRDWLKDGRILAEKLGLPSIPAPPSK